MVVDDVGRCTSTTKWPNVFLPPESTASSVKNCTPSGRPVICTLLLETVQLVEAGRTETVGVFPSGSLAENLIVASPSLEVT